MTGDRIHKRSIDVESFPLEGGQVLIVGHLVDHHSFDVEPIKGDIKPAGIIHDMTLELEVGLSDFKINAVRGTMAKRPYPACIEALPAVDEIVGLSVVSGFTRNMKQRIGGPKCCAHLVSLLLAMAPVVLQSAQEVDEQPVQPRPIETSAIANTCHVWRADGPLFPILQNQMAERKKTPSLKR